MEIGDGRIVRCECAVFYEITVLGNLGDVLSAYEIRRGFRSHIGSANLLRLGVINAMIGNVQTYVAVDADMTLCQYFVRMRIVLRVIGINIRIAYMNSNVVMGRGEPVLVTRFAG